MIVSARMFGVEAGRVSWRPACVLALLAASLAGCAQAPSQYARHGHEYFSTAKYGPASERVIADGQPVPHGGGQYLVGHPYTIAGRTYYPHEVTNYSAVGMASWYGDAFHGRRTANGEIYDMRSFTAAHPTMPLPSYARVTNLANGYSIIVVASIDRGPYHGGRVMDVSSRVADVLDFKNAGTAKVKVDYVGPATDRGLRQFDIAREPAHQRRARHVGRPPGDGVAAAAATITGGPPNVAGAPFRCSRATSNRRSPRCGAGPT